MLTTMASGKVAPLSRNAHCTSPGASCADDDEVSAQRLHRRVLVAVARGRLHRHAVVLLVADQHPGLARAQQVGHDRQRNATTLDLEGAVSLAVQDQYVAKAVAHEQVQKTGTVARNHGQPGGLVADRNAERVAERAIPVPGIDPDLAGVLHQYGQIEFAVAVEVAGHDRAGAVVDA